MHRPALSRFAAASLLGGVSLLSLTTGARAASVLFSSDGAISTETVRSGGEVTLTTGLIQLRLDNGATASFVDAARFAIRADSSIDLRAGSVTVVNGAGGSTIVHLPEGVDGTIAGAASSGSFTVFAGGSRGSSIVGGVTIVWQGALHRFTAGQFWNAAAGRAPARVIANAAVAVPDGQVRPVRVEGVVAAARNGTPVNLGESLAAIGASGDVVQAARRIEAWHANPRLPSFPIGDYNLLFGYAARAASPYGGPAFPGAGADIVLTYFQYLARGGAGQGAGFQAAYAQILLNYFTLLRAGALPSAFTGATQVQLNAYLAFIGRTSGFGGLSAANQQLLDAYLTFLRGGGTADTFGGNVQALGASYLNYLRGGGDPARFAQASSSVVAQYLAILQSGGLKAGLTAQDQALLDAYLANGSSIAFSQSYATSLAAFVAYLNAGGLPSRYTALSAGTIRLYLQTLSDTGLFDQVLGNQAAFLRSYLSYIQAGGTADAFDRLPINISTAQAAALNSYVAYLNAGNLPSGYGALTTDQVKAYIAALQSANQLAALTGANATFLANYYAYLGGGGAIDLYSGLPINVLRTQATALNVYFDYIQAGGLPSAYTALTQAQVQAYLTALRNAGFFTSLLGVNAGFYGDYYAYLVSGANPDLYAGLPNVDVNAYAASLRAFVAYLNAGNLPSGYTGATADQIRAYITALSISGRLGTLLGGDATLLSTYLDYLRAGGSPDQFGGLPIVAYASYATQLNAFVAYLNAGGLPSGYTALTQAQVQAYLQALRANNQLAALLGGNAALLGSYFAYLVAGGAADAFGGLPIATYRSYATALTAYYAFLNAGGLPSAYTALTAAQIQAYLDALKTNGQLAALLGGNAAFFDAYYAFIRTGASADGYASLPVVTYRNYAAALTLYYAYLNAGGLPSAYAALTQAQVRAYIEALQATGQSAVFLGSSTSFFASYLAYVQSGGTPDRYAALPANASVAALPSPGYAYAGGFTPSGGRAATVYGVTSGSTTVANLSGYASASPTVTDNGTVRQVVAGTAIGSAQAVDVAGNARALVGRWTNGTVTAGGNSVTLSATQGLHTLALQSATFLLPTSGKIDYRLLAATQPTYASGYGNAGLFDARLAIQFGSTPLIGIDGTIHMPEADGTHSYTVTTAGGTATPGVSSAIFSPTALRFAADLRGSGAACADTTCGVLFDGGFSGVNADVLGFAYSTSGGRDSIIGTAAFTSTSPQAIPTSTQLSSYASALASYYSYLATGAKPSGYAALTAAQIQAYLEALYAAGQNAQLAANQEFFAGYLSYVRAGSNPDSYTGLPVPATVLSSKGVFVPIASAGAFRGSMADFDSNSGKFALNENTSGNAVIQSNGSVTSVANGGIRIGTASVVELGGDKYATIGRWTNGTVGRAGVTVNLTGNQGFHYLLLDASSAVLPTRGTVDYSIFARTEATWVRADLPQGLFDAKMRLAFSSNNLPKVVVLGALSMPETTGLTTYSFGTQAAYDDVANLGTFFYNDPSSAFTEALSGTGTACVTGTNCIITFRGGAAGPNGARIGFTYQAGPLQTSNPQIEGAVIFGANGTFDDKSVAANPNQLTAALGSLTNLANALRGGTRPSAYAALTPAQTLVAWQTLSDGFTSASQLAGLDQTNLGFLAGYIGYLYTGAAADSYAGLPAGSTGSLPAPTYAYAAGLPTSQLKVRATTLENGALSTQIITPAAVTLASGGGLDKIGTGTNPQDFTRGTAQQNERWGDDRVVVGRWSNGTYKHAAADYTLGANQSFHYVLMAPIAFNMPYLGRVDYTLLAATQPTYANGQTGAGLFDAKMAILFASRPRIALEGTLRMPEPSGTVTYSFATAGGIADPSKAALTDFTSGNFGVTAPVTGAGLACTTGCNLFLNGSFAGADPLRVGATYFLTDSRATTANIITGAAAFTGTWNGAAQTVSTPKGYSFFATTNHSDTLNPNSIQSGGSFDVNGSGQVVGLTTTSGLYDRLGTASLTDTGQTADGAVTWQRWAGGTLDTLRNGSTTVQFGANDGYHIITGTPLTALPTAGTFNFTLAGYTRVTQSSGAYTPGSLSGAAVVAFGATPTATKVGFDLTASINGTSYNLFTTGKLANVAQSQLTLASATGNFSGVSSGTVTSTGNDCGTGCNASWVGFLAGAGAADLGLYYRVSGGSGVDLQGVAGFTKGAAVSTAGVQGNLSQAPTAPQIAAMASSLSDLNTGVTASGSIGFDAGTGTVTIVNNGTKRVAPTTVGTYDQGSIAGVIGWARWANGAVNTNPGGATFSGSNGANFIWGTPATNVPTTGTATYDVVASTTPSTFAGGTVVSSYASAATLGVDFAGRKVGWTATLGINGNTFGFSTSGGAAAPSVALAANNSWSTTLDSSKGVTGTATGFLAGAAAGYAGMTYAVDGLYGTLTFAKR